MNFEAKPGFGVADDQDLWLRFRPDVAWWKGSHRAVSQPDCVTFKRVTFKRVTLKHQKAENIWMMKSMKKCEDLNLSFFQTLESMICLLNLY